MLGTNLVVIIIILLLLMLSREVRAWGVDVSEHLVQIRDTLSVINRNICDFGQKFEEYCVLSARQIDPQAPLVLNWDEREDVKQMVEEARKLKEQEESNQEQ